MWCRLRVPDRGSVETFHEEHHLGTAADQYLKGLSGPRSRSRCGESCQLVTSGSPYRQVTVLSVVCDRLVRIGQSLADRGEDASISAGEDDPRRARNDGLRCIRARCRPLSVSGSTMQRSSLSNQSDMCVHHPCGQRHPSRVSRARNLSRTLSGMVLRSARRARLRRHRPTRSGTLQPRPMARRRPFPSRRRVLSA